MTCLKVDSTNFFCSHSQGGDGSLLNA